MEVKLTFIGICIYLAMACYLAAFIAMIAKAGKLARVVFGAGCALAVVAVIARVFEVQRVPMQSMFEVFLLMGAFVYPVGLFCQRVLRIKMDKIDPLIGVFILFPAGFSFQASAQQLPPALQYWLFAPHVAVYLLGYLFMFKAAAVAAGQMLTPAQTPLARSYEDDTYRLIRLGFPFITLGLILGAWWGKIAWGDYWNWDPKEMWALAMWLGYAGYLHFRIATKRKYLRTNSFIAIMCAVVILCTLLWANLSRLFAGGLHSYA